MQQKRRRNKNDKRYGPRTEARKAQMKLERADKVGAHDFVVRPEDGAELRRITASGGRFVHQDLIDQWRTMKW
mgnify:CR=1 FL=1